MKYVYFTKTLRELDVPGLIKFCQEVGLDGVDLTVRPGYPVNPGNVATELPRAVKSFKEAGLIVGLVTAPTDLIDPESKPARALFEACGKAGVGNIKIGYFPYRGKIDEAHKSARNTLAGFARLAQATRVRACYHTHSGAYLGANCALLRMMLENLDPHQVGAFVDTGHVAVNGAPFRLEADLVRAWLALVAIKDMAWHHQGGRWRVEVVPVGDGIVRWNEVGQALREQKFNGTISLHGEYEAKDLASRKALAKKELAALKKVLGS